MAGRVEESVWGERREWIRRQQESGLSAAQFCRDHSLHEGNFHSWRRRFAKVDGCASVGGRNSAGGRQSLQAFVQLPMPVVAAVSHRPSWIEVSVADGMVVRVTPQRFPLLAHQ